MTGNGAGSSLPGAAGDMMCGMINQMGETWSATNAMWSALLGGWQSMLTNRAAPAAQAVIGHILTPSAWPEGLGRLFEELQQILAMPRFSDLPALDPASLPSLAPAAELIATLNQFMMAAVPLWFRACERFQTEAAARRQNGANGFSAGDALDVWNSVLDRTLMEFNRSTEFGALQQRLLRAAMAQRRETRKFGEQLAQTVDLPTRTELDDVYRRLHDLLGEVHSLRRELRAVKRAIRPAAESAPEPERAPAPVAAISGPTKGKDR